MESLDVPFHSWPEKLGIFHLWHLVVVPSGGALLACVSSACFLSAASACLHHPPGSLWRSACHHQGQQQAIRVTQDEEQEEEEASNGLFSAMKSICMILAPGLGLIMAALSLTPASSLVIGIGSDFHDQRLGTINRWSVIIKRRRKRPQMDCFLPWIESMYMILALGLGLIMASLSLIPASSLCALT